MKKVTTPGMAAFLLTAVLLSFVHFKVDPPILLLERVIPGTGLIEVLLLALYSGWITRKMLSVRNSGNLRFRIWTLFSIVFFTQFVLGISGVEKFLMTGVLHLPVPALIFAGPVFRGGGLFMPILFGATILLSGPAWCSHLCYVGCWDNLAAMSRRRPEALPRWSRPVRTVILISVLLTALIFRLSGMNVWAATGAAILFGVVGVGIMVFVSRKKGIMTHCLVYCPVGLMANLFGKISPFRIKFKKSCDECGACRNFCRYNALEEKDIQSRKPGLTCTLCGDCLAGCSKRSLTYGFFRMDPETARILFVVIIVSLHAVFLGVARI